MKPIDVITAPWAIMPAKLAEITEIYSTHLRGEKIDIARVEAALGRPLQNAEQGYTVDRGVAIVPVDGVMAKRFNMFSRISGGASTEMIARDVQQAAADPAVSAIILAIDSPGGAVDGTQSLAAVIRAAADQKPVVAFADGLMASAAYWVGAAADSIVMSSDTTLMGSIGVVSQHVDVSGYEQRIGIKTTEIFAGKYKRIASEYSPLTQEGRETMQSMVDELYSIFVGEVAKYRGVSVDKVLSDMADGRILIGQQAIAAGLADGVSALDALVEQLASGAYQSRRKGGAAGGAVIPVAPLAVVSGAVADAGAGGAPADASDNSISSEVEKMDLKELQEKHSALFAEVLGMGAKAERERILAVEAQSMPGHEDIIAAAKADGKTTGPEAAALVLAAEKAARGTAAGNLATDAGKPAASAPAETAAPATGSVEERAKAAWEKNANGEQAEFGSFKTFEAYFKANDRGLVRIVKQAA